MNTEMSCFDDSYFGFIGRPNVTAVYSPVKQEHYADNHSYSFFENYCRTDESKNDCSSDDASELSQTPTTPTKDVTVLSGAMTDESMSYSTPEKFQPDYTGQDANQTQTLIANPQYITQTPFSTGQPTYIMQQQYVTPAQSHIPYGNQHFQTVQFTLSPPLAQQSVQQIISQPQVITQSQGYTNGITQPIPQQQIITQNNQTANFHNVPIAVNNTNQTIFVPSSVAGLNSNGTFIIEQSSPANGFKQENRPLQAKLEIINTPAEVPVKQEMQYSDEENSRCSFGSLPDGQSSADVSQEVPNIRCNICGAEFLSQKLLTSHKQKAHPSAPGVKKDSMKAQKYCLECGASFTTKQQLEKHMQYRHSNNPVDDGKGSGQTITCPICGKEYSKHYYRSHMDYHAGKRYTCDLCGIEFPYRRKLQRHKKFHENTNEFKCPIRGCDMSFNSEIALKKHTKIHNDC